MLESGTKPVEASVAAQAEFAGAVDGRIPIGKVPNPRGVEFCEDGVDEGNHLGGKKKRGCCPKCGGTVDDCWRHRGENKKSDIAPSIDHDWLTLYGMGVCDIPVTSAAVG